MARGNPSWGEPQVSEMVSLTPTEFERTVAILKLQPDEYVNSVQLREWVQKNRNSRYVPEALLMAWKIEVHVTM